MLDFFIDFIAKLLDCDGLIFAGGVMYGRLSEVYSTPHMFAKENEASEEKVQQLILSFSLNHS